ncbi:hypothetical protein [Vreelandella venusta]|uniref:hypothetical protein n=1 Tax=Vreelandella venusta TaxID=44935 RepID=UPI003AA891F0
MSLSGRVGIRQFQFVGLPSVTVWRGAPPEWHIDELTRQEAATDRKTRRTLEDRAAATRPWDQFYA